MKAEIFIFLAIFLAGFQMTTAQENNGFALYLLPQNIKSGDLSKLDINKIKPSGTPFISANGIWSYLKDTHQMVLNYEAGLRLKKLHVPVGGRPFVVFVDNQPIYTGAFWTNLSSISFEGVAIDVSDLNGDFPTLRFDLGYPPLAVNPNASDPRSDPRILRTLEKGGQLREQVWLYGKCTQIHATGKRRQSYVFTFDVTSVVKSTYDHKTVTFERFDDVGKSLRSAVEVKWDGEAYGDENWSFNRDEEILLKFERPVSDDYQNVYLSDFEIKK